MIKHYQSDLLKNYVRKDANAWHIFSNRIHHRGTKIDDLFLVTHSYLTSSWAAAVATEISGDFSISLPVGVPGLVDAEISASREVEHKCSVLRRSGPQRQLTPADGNDGEMPTVPDQNVFVRGWKVEKRLFRTLVGIGKCYYATRTFESGSDMSTEVHTHKVEVQSVIHSGGNFYAHGSF